MDYTGDVTAAEVWEILKNNKSAVVIDVRTDAEWAFVGVPNLSETDRSPLFISWQIFPHMEIDSDFADRITAQEISKNRPLYFICRSGVRSAAAAALMIKAGYEKCYNVSGGFEGDCNEKGHRGLLNGWKATGLPWHQN